MQFVKAPGVLAGWLWLSVALAAGEFRAGAAAVNIDPPTLPVLVNGGMTERRIDVITDPLHVRTLCLSDGRTTLVLGVVDSCMVPRALLDDAKERASQETGIPVEQMLLSATHAHSAPAATGCLGTDADPAYVEFLPGKIAEAIILAHGRLAPARVGWGVGVEPKNVFVRDFEMKPGTAQTALFTGVRENLAQMNPGHLNANAVRRLAEPDPEVSVLSVQTAAGRPLALFANYSTHYVGAPGLSADYFGVFATKIAEKLDAVETPEGEPAFVGILSNGTSGDANCLDFTREARKFDRFTVAEDVATVAAEVYAKIEHHSDLVLSMVEESLELPIRMPSEEEVEAAREFLAEREGMPPRTVDEVYARETILLAEGPPTRELRLQAIRIGDLGIAAIPCEVYSSTGLAIKRESTLRPTFTVSLANGYEGYIPPKSQFALGGYTTWRARSSCLVPEAEEEIRTTVLGLLEAAADSP